MHELVIHERVHAFAGRESFESEPDRRNVDKQHVARHGAGGSIAIVAKVFEKNGYLAIRVEAEARLLAG